MAQALAGIMGSGGGAAAGGSAAGGSSMGSMMGGAAAGAGGSGGSGNMLSDIWQHAVGGVQKSTGKALLEAQPNSDKGASEFLAAIGRPIPQMQQIPSPQSAQAAAPQSSGGNAEQEMGLADSMLAALGNYKPMEGSRSSGLPKKNFGLSLMD